MSPPPPPPTHPHPPPPTTTTHTHTTHTHPTHPTPPTHTPTHTHHTPAARSRPAHTQLRGPDDGDGGAARRGGRHDARRHAQHGGHDGQPRRLGAAVPRGGPHLRGCGGAERSCCAVLGHPALRHVALARPRCAHGMQPTCKRACLANLRSQPTAATVNPRHPCLQACAPSSA